MKSIARRIERITKKMGMDSKDQKVIIVLGPSVPCELLDFGMCPEYIKAQQSSSGIAICHPSCGDCAELDRGKL